MPEKVVSVKHHRAGSLQEQNKDSQGKNLPPKPVVLASLLYYPRTMERLASGDKTQGYTGFVIFRTGKLPGKGLGSVMGELRKGAEKHAEQEEGKKG